MKMGVRPSITEQVDSDSPPGILRTMPKKTATGQSGPAHTTAILPGERPGWERT